MKTTHRSEPTEHDIQVALFDWMTVQYPRVPVYAIPNAAKRSFAAARYLRKEGLRPGVPDVCVARAVDGFHGLYLELKRRKGGVLSEEQHEWLNRLSDEGYACAVVHGLDAAMEAVDSYLGGAWYELVARHSGTRS